MNTVALHFLVVFLVLFFVGNFLVVLAHYPLLFKGREGSTSAEKSLVFLGTLNMIYPCCFSQGSTGSVRFGCGLGVEQFERFRLSVPAVPLQKGFLRFQYSLTGKDGSGS